jgi:glucosamine--fructose-6-phosphate aminotransferase (isomerizing)
MCGIIGYVGKNHNAVDVLIDGLKSLEYRGYDSAGIAFMQNHKLKIVKTSGKVKNLEDRLKLINKKGANIGIGHTRWATHGIPNDINAHPHSVGNVTLIHNGIIENYEELKKELIKNGYKFKSDTDTEIACALIDYTSKKESNKIKILISISSKLKGSYALGIIFSDEKNIIYAIRKDSPLIIGIGNDENFIASDVPAILKYTNKYIYLDKNEYAKITHDNVSIYDGNEQLIDKKIEEASWSIDQALKNNYEHFMLKEIYEQPKVVSNIINKYIDNLKDQMIDFNKYQYIHIVGCGSAMHAGMIGKSIIEKYSSIKIDVEIASEYRYRNITYNKKTLVIIISQSGETADSLAALKKANENNIDTLAIVNVIGSSIAREARYVMYMHAGPEIAVATTKAFSVQVALLSLIAFKLSNSKINDSINDYKKIDKYLEEVLSYRDKYIDIANILYNKEHVFFIGRGIDYALCMEGSLKLKEISYIHSEAYSAGELKHGTISLIDNNTPVIAIATDKDLIDKTISNIKETKARGSYVIYITTEEFNIDADFYDKKIVLPTTNDFISPLITTIPLQLIAYETARMKELDIDKPRNLAKSVTVE